MSRFGKSQGVGPEGRAAAVLAAIVRRYRALRRRLAERLGRGEQDYGALSSMSQEIGLIRQKIRDDLARRRARRRMRSLPGGQGSG